MKYVALFLVLTGFLCGVLRADDQHTMQMSQTSEMEMRGDAVMGFDHTKTTHHFYLTPEGGSIQVTANDPKDTDSSGQIQMHLKHIAGMFADGNFQAPILIHSTQHPPGTDTMIRLKGQIRYEYQKLSQGAAVSISSQDKEAISAIHDFLKFQIQEHQTGDPTDVKQHH